MVRDIPLADDIMITFVSPNAERKRQQRSTVILPEPMIILKLSEHGLKRRTARLRHWAM